MPKILIVDDNEDEVRRPLKRQLGRIHGSDNILEAENGRVALEIIRLGRPDVIILDVMMPIMDGVSACQAIRADQDNIGIYIIMLTGRDGGMPEGLEVGADIYLRKPCDFEELVAVVGKGLEEVKQYKKSMDHQRTLESQVENLNDLHWVFQDIITSLSTGLILCTPNATGGIRYINPAAKELIDRPSQELRDLPVGQLFLETDMGRLLEDILSNAKPHDVPKTLKAMESGSIPVLLSGRIICNTQGKEKWIMLEVRTL
jgi:two-component system, cell cycle response regulator DivK